MKNVLYVEDYSSPGERETTYRLKANNEGDMKHAAQKMAKLVPKYYILIPVPGHTGVPIATKKLCQEISKITGNVVCDIIRGNDRPSWCFLKKRGILLTDEDFGFQCMGDIPKGLNILFIDNVYATGTTYRALKKLIPSAKILVYSIDKTMNNEP